MKSKLVLAALGSAVLAMATSATARRDAPVIRKALAESKPGTAPVLPVA
jgi:hypothetical protein